MNHEMETQGREWRRVLIVVSKQILSTWKDEFAKWIPQRPYPIRFITADNSDRQSRKEEIRKWHRKEGGVLVISGRLFQLLTSYEAGAFRRLVVCCSELLGADTHRADPMDFEGLLHPDLVIVDEGTNLKNIEVRERIQ
jgi:hypothetical protein